MDCSSNTVMIVSLQPPRQQPKEGGGEEASASASSTPSATSGLNVNVTVTDSRAQMQVCHPSPATAVAVGYQAYPAAVASHREVVADRVLFMATLNKFHAEMGTKLSIPKIGGKDLDLHFLYKEVTGRGGLQMVIKERKWKEIALALNFPPTTTSASFVLRKFYSNFLHHYEQVYLFRAKGPMIPPPAAPANASPATSQLSEIEHVHSAPEDPEPDFKKQKIDSAQVLGVDPASSIGSIVTGSIDGKFECGYLITVMVGTRKMRGVLYHLPPTGTRPQGACVSTFMNSIGTDLRASDIEDQIGRRRRRKELSRKDPNAPRQNRSGYTFFFAEQRAKLKTAEPDKNREISKMIGDLWNRMPEEEKSPYQERGLQDKERYKREMQEYKERCRFQQEHVDGVNISESGFQKDMNESHTNNDVCNTA